MIRLKSEREKKKKKKKKTITTVISLWTCGVWEFDDLQVVLISRLNAMDLVQLSHSNHVQTHSWQAPTMEGRANDSIW